MALDGAMEEFWSNIADDDPRLIQLAKGHPDVKRKCVPIIIHGDDQYVKLFHQDHHHPDYHGNGCNLDQSAKLFHQDHHDHNHGNG